MKKLLLIMICLVLLVGTVNAELTTFDNTLKYENNDLKVTVKNLFGLGKTFGSLELKSHTSVDELKKVEVGEVIPMWYYNNFIELYEDGLGEVNFKNIDTGEEIIRDYSFVIREEEVYQVPIYENQCNTLVNGTKICGNVVVGQKDEVRNVWVDYNSNDIPKGISTIGLKVFVNPLERIDAVWTIAGKKIKKHAGFTGTYQFTDNAVSTADTSIYTFAGINFSIADEQRVMVVATGGRGAGAPKGVNNLTIGGVNATLGFRADEGGSSVEIWYAEVPTGTSGTIIVNWNGTQFRSGIGSWALYTDNSTPHDFNRSIVGSGDTLINILENGVVIAYSYDTEDLVTWTGVTEDFDEVVEGIQHQSGAFNGSITGDVSGYEISRGAGATGEDVMIAVSWGLLSPPTVTLNSPINAFNSSSNSITFNGSILSSSGIINVSLFLDGVINETNSSTVNDSDYFFTKTFIDGLHNWTYEACSGVGCTIESIRNFTIDSTFPQINITFPTAIVNYQRINTNLSVNWTVSDLNLDICILEYEEANTTVTCSDNQTNINITNSINRSIIFYANDTFGNSNLSSRSWNYTIFENSRSFSANTLEGTTELIQLNYSIDPSFQASTVNLVYNGTQHSTTITPSGQIVISTINLAIPSVTVEENISFFWSIVLTSGLIINTSASNQTVGILSLDDCSVNTNLVYNFTLNDEETQEILSNTSMDIEVIIFDTSRSNSFVNFSKAYNETENPALVCLSTALLEATNYSIDSTVKYNSNDSGNSYATEYYNVLNFTLANSTIPQNILLYDLLSTDSTDFQLTFKDSNLAFFPNILVHVDRQYVSDNDFKTVEIPITDSNGQTVLHLVRNDIVYNFIMVDSKGEVVATFNKIIAFCQDFTIGSCTIKLNAFSTEEQFFNST